MNKPTKRVKPVPPALLQRTMISPEQAARYSGLSARTLRRYIADGRLPGYRIGPRVVRIDLAELNALLIRLPSSPL